MVEKGTDRRRASPGDTPLKYKGQVRVVKNSNLANPQGVVIPLKKRLMDGKSEGLAKKSGSTTVQSPVLLLSPSSVQGSPKLRGIGGSVSSSPSSREGSPRTSPTLGCNYAGAKFSEPPSPDSLPKPPPQWTDCFYISSEGVFPIFTPDKTDKYREITQQLKNILKVPA